MACWLSVRKNSASEGRRCASSAAQVLGELHLAHGQLAVRGEAPATAGRRTAGSPWPAGRTRRPGATGGPGPPPGRRPSPSSAWATRSFHSRCCSPTKPAAACSRASRSARSLSSPFGGARPRRSGSCFGERAATPAGRPWPSPPATRARGAGRPQMTSRVASVASTSAIIQEKCGSRLSHSSRSATSPSQRAGGCGGGSGGATAGGGGTGSGSGRGRLAQARGRWDRGSGGRPSPAAIPWTAAARGASPAPARRGRRPTSRGRTRSGPG